MKDYYKILGVTPKATQAEIKAAYRLLAVRHHPDKNNGDKASEERFKEISESYIILGDVAKRNAYDYTKGHQKLYRDPTLQFGQPTPITYLLLFKRIKDKVLHANGKINKNALFKVLDDLLSDDTIVLLLRAQDIATNNLIIDDILTCCIFLEGTSQNNLYTKLKKLANDDPWFLEKLTLINAKPVYIAKTPPPAGPMETTKEPSLLVAVLVFTAIIVFIITLLAL